MFKSQLAETLFSMLRMSVVSGGQINRMQPAPGADEELDYLRPNFESLSDDQAVALTQAIFHDDHALTITGKAGTGKTYFIKLLRNILESCFYVNVVVCAYTGLASQNVGGAGTLNSVFSCGMGNFIPWDECEETEKGKGRRNALTVARRGSSNSVINNFNPRYPSIYIIDEMSVTPSELLNGIYQIALYKNGAEQSVQAAANNIRFIVCGDSMQLLPVNKKSKRSPWKNPEIVSFPWQEAKWDLGGGRITKEPSLLYDGPFSGFKSSRLALITNHRQKEERDFANALNYVRLGGKLNEGPAKVLTTRVLSLNKGLEVPDSLDTMHVYATNAKAAKKNRQVVGSLPESKRKTYHASVQYQEKKNVPVVFGEIVREEKYKPGRYEIDGLVVNQKIKESQYKEQHIPKKWIPDWAEPVMELGIGLPFMIRQNMPDRDLFNGTIGVIKELHDTEIEIELENGRRETIFAQECIGVDQYRDDGQPVGTYVGLPGHICVALTAHKTQGLSLSRPVVLHIDERDANWIGKSVPHWTYVALSRVTHLKYLFIDASITNINTSINVERSAYDFALEAEEKMQDECRGLVTVDTPTPEDVRAGRPLLLLVEQDSEQFTFSFQVYFEDEEFPFKAFYQNGKVTYYDEELQETHTAESWGLHEEAWPKINRYLESINNDESISGKLAPVGAAAQSI